MKLISWAKKWNIPEDAFKELLHLFGIDSQSSDSNCTELSESAVLNLIRLEATQKGCRVWRNNVGAAYMKDGSFLRYGLANESSRLNKEIKSADLIGIRPVLITQTMVGSTIGQFISREVKKGDWKYSGNEREQAQLKWAQLIIALGGDACFANREGTL